MISFQNDDKSDCFNMYDITQSILKLPIGLKVC